MNRRVLLCDSARIWGGVEHWFVLTAQELIRRGWETVIAGRTGTEFLRRAAAEGVETIGWPFSPDFDPRTMLAAHRRFRQKRPDLVLLVSGREIRTVGLTAHRHRIPVVAYMGMPDPKCGFVHRVSGKWVIDRVIAPSDDSRRLLESFSWLRGKVDIVPNGIEAIPTVSPEDRLRCRDRLGWKPGEFIILFVGRLRHVKGADILIRAYANLVKDHPDTRLVVVGTGTEDQPLEELSDSLGLSSRVTFTGYQADPGPFYDACDLFVLPSRQEPFGFVLLEAMIRHCPIVATRVGGVPEVVGQEAALLVPSEDVGALASAMETLVREAELRARLGTVGRERAKRLYSLSEMHDRTESVLLAVIENHQRGGPMAAKPDDPEARQAAEMAVR